MVILTVLLTWWGPRRESFWPPSNLWWAQIYSSPANRTLRWMMQSSTYCTDPSHTWKTLEVPWGFVFVFVFFSFGVSFAFNTIQPSLWGGGREKGLELSAIWLRGPSTTEFVVKQFVRQLQLYHIYVYRWSLGKTCTEICCQLLADISSSWCTYYSLFFTVCYRASSILSIYTVHYIYSQLLWKWADIDTPFYFD